MKNLKYLTAGIILGALFLLALTIYLTITIGSPMNFVGMDTWMIVTILIGGAIASILVVILVFWSVSVFFESEPIKLHKNIKHVIRVVSYYDRPSSDNILNIKDIDSFVTSLLEEGWELLQTDLLDMTDDEVRILWVLAR